MRHSSAFASAKKLGVGFDRAGQVGEGTPVVVAPTTGEAEMTARPTNGVRLRNSKMVRVAVCAFAACVGAACTSVDPVGIVPMTTDGGRAPSVDGPLPPPLPSADAEAPLDSAFAAKDSSGPDALDTTPFNPDDDAPVGAARCPVPLGEVALWAGKVNVHRSRPDGQWQVDADCSSGTYTERLAYCRKFWPSTAHSTLLALSSDNKPFAGGSFGAAPPVCGGVDPFVGKLQYQCCGVPAAGDGGVGDAAPRDAANPDAASPTSRPLAVAFVGNSYTHYLSDIPTMFHDVAFEAGKRVDVDAFTSLGATLEGFLASPDLRPWLASRNWDVLVLQEQSGRAQESTGPYPRDVAAFVNLMRGINPCTRIAIYPPPFAFQGAADRVIAAANVVASQNGALVFPVATVFKNATGTALADGLFEDGAHPSTFLGAYTIGSTIARMLLPSSSPVPPIPGMSASDATEVNRWITTAFATPPPGTARPWDFGAAASATRPRWCR